MADQTSATTADTDRVEDGRLAVHTGFARTPRPEAPPRRAARPRDPAQPG